MLGPSFGPHSWNGTSVAGWPRTGGPRRVNEPGGAPEGMQGVLARRPAIPLQQLLAGKLMALIAIDQVEQQNQREIDAKDAKRENGKWRHGESSFLQAFR